MRSKINIIITIVAISFIQGLQFTVSPILEQIRQYYSGVNVSLIQLLVTIPNIMSIVLAFVSGYLALKMSKKKILIIGAAVAGISGFLPFLNDSFAMLFGTRILYGIGLGIATTLNTAVVAEFFEGNERTVAMGIQSASVGTGMVVVNALSGVIGAPDFHRSYWVHIIAFISLLVIMFALPDTGKAQSGNNEKIELNGEVVRVALTSFAEMLFLITFSTNIALHISGALAGNSAAAGTLTALFSAIQIVAGFVLAFVVKAAKKYTMPVAMLSFSIGAVLLLLFPDKMAGLAIGAMFCGFSQGIFVPRSMVEVTNAVPAASAAMATAVLVAGQCLGQFCSPLLTNAVSKALFGEVSTHNVFLISAVGMTAAAVIVIVSRTFRGRKHERG